MSRREDRHARDVAWQQVGVALEPRQVGAERGGEGLSENGLSDTRHVLDQQVPAAQRCYGDSGQCSWRSEDDVTQVGYERLAELYGVVETRRLLCSCQGLYDAGRHVECRGERVRQAMPAGQPRRVELLDWLRLHDLRRLHGCAVCADCAGCAGRICSAGSTG